MGKKKAFLLRNPAAYLKSQRNTYQDFVEDLLSTTCILCKTTSFRKQSSPACAANSTHNHAKERHVFLIIFIQVFHSSYITNYSKCSNSRIQKLNNLLQTKVKWSQMQNINLTQF